MWVYIFDVFFSTNNYFPAHMFYEYIHTLLYSIYIVYIHVLFIFWHSLKGLVNSCYLLYVDILLFHIFFRKV